MCSGVHLATKPCDLVWMSLLGVFLHLLSSSCFYGILLNTYYLFCLVQHLMSEQVLNASKAEARSY